jgi:hypothetical protein
LRLFLHFPENDYPRDNIGPRDETTTGSAKVVVDSELAHEVEVSISLQKKRRGVTNSERSLKNDAAGDDHPHNANGA